jgi:hypothetical protein
MDDGALQVLVRCFESHVVRQVLLARKEKKAMPTMAGLGSIDPTHLSLYRVIDTYRPQLNPRSLSIYIQLPWGPRKW